jgi:hypothetical protein
MKFTVADGKLTTSVKIKDLDFDACDGGDNFANNNLVGRARRLYLSDAKKEAIEETLVGSTAGKVSRRQPFDLRLNCACDMVSLLQAKTNPVPPF